MHQETQLSREIKAQFTGLINIYPSPLPGTAPIQIKAPAGTKIMDYLPHDRTPWVCIANGIPLRRDYWLDRTVQVEDNIQLCPVVFGGGGGSRSILAMVASIALSIFAPYLAAGIMGSSVATMGAVGSLLSAGIVLVGTALINAIIAPKAPSQDAASASNTYNVSLSANQARLNQPIPVGYGRMRTFPDYAAQPYTEYDTASNGDGDQYFYALFAIGQGEYSITAVMLADSDISSFNNVDYKILKPGEQPTIVNPTVVTGVEVGGQVLSTTPVGPFAACGPTRRLTHIGIDLVFNKGLTDIHMPTGAAGPMTVTVLVDIVEINDAFKFMGKWERLATEAITASSATPQRRSFKYAVPVPGRRYAVRVSRTTPQSTNVDHYDECSWSALRGYLDGGAPLSSNTTHLEIRMKATEQLSGVSQRKIGVLWNRMVRTWSPDTGFSAPVTTRNPMWALMDKWTDPVYGDKLPLERVDLETLHHLAQVADARKDRFDFIFDAKTTSFEADQLIARTLRSTPVRRNGVRSVVRDERKDLPVTAYTARTILKGTTSMQYMQITEETADGVIIEYFDRNAFDWIEVECPAPGRTYTYPGHPGYDPSLPSMENPVRMQLPGVTGPWHAEREGLYHAAANVLRRKYCTWSTEMQGALAWFGAPVLFSPLLHNSSQSGDCAFYNAATLQLSLTEQPQLTPTSQIILMRPDGTLTDPIPVTPGEDEYSVKLAHVPGFTLRLADSRIERTKYVLIDSIEHRNLCKILAIRPNGNSGSGAPVYELFAVVEDDRVHQVDNHLIPAEDEDPDAPEPWTKNDGEEGSEEPENPGTDPETPLEPYVVVSTKARNDDEKPYFYFYPDGRVKKVYWTDAGKVEEFIPGQWYANAPQPNIGMQYSFQVSRPIAATAEGGYMWVKLLDPQAMGNMLESEWLMIANEFKLEMDENTQVFEGFIKFRDNRGVIQNTYRLHMSAVRG